MELVAIILIMLGLSNSSFSVALNSSIYRCIEWAETFRIAVVFAFFQGAMLGLGWLIGNAMDNWFKDMSFPVAILILFFIGGRLILESRSIDPERRIIIADDFKWLAGFAFLTSINTFLTGISLGILTGRISTALAVLFIMIFLVVILGTRLGKRSSFGLSRIAGLAGGIILVLVAAMVLIQYLVPTFY